MVVRRAGVGGLREWEGRGGGGGRERVYRVWQAVVEVLGHQRFEDDVCARVGRGDVSANPPPLSSELRRENHQGPRSRVTLCEFHQSVADRFYGGFFDYHDVFRLVGPAQRKQLAVTALYTALSTLLEIREEGVVRDLLVYRGCTRLGSSWIEWTSLHGGAVEKRRALLGKLERRLEIVRRMVRIGERSNESLFGVDVVGG